MKTYFALLEDINNSRKTQVATTGGTYKKTGEFLKDKLPAKSKIISIGAGLDHTKPALLSGLGSGHEVHDMEPNPEGRKVKPEFTEASQVPKNHYDAAVSHNVVNVVEPHIRDHVMHSMFNSVKEGGHIVIGTRKWKGDIDQAKNFESAEEHKAMWVLKGKDKSYQKGFDGNELKDYAQSYADKHGHTVEIKKLPGISANGIHIHLKKKAV